MNWLEVLAILVGNAAVVIPLWLHMDNKIHEQNNLIADHNRRMDEKMASFRELWAAETKDFHARLYNLEERYRAKHPH